MANKSHQTIQAIEFPRADHEALAAFDENTKRCTMNCGPHRQDPRSEKERQFLCDECETVTPSSNHIRQSISTRQYTDAVTSLIKWAQKDCGASRVCAQVLLSAYNGGAFQLNIVDLGLLDERMLADAMTVILGRTTLNMEPHELIDDGDKIFDALWRQWKAYHVKERWMWG